MGANRRTMQRRRTAAMEARDDRERARDERQIERRRHEHGALVETMRSLDPRNRRRLSAAYGCRIVLARRVVRVLRIHTSVRRRLVASRVRERRAREERMHGGGRNQLNDQQRRASEPELRHLAKLRLAPGRCQLRHGAGADTALAVKTLLGLALATLLASCGGGGGRVSLETRFERVSSCTGLAAPFPLIRVEPAIECPTSRTRCCLEGVAFQPCPQGQCGANGRYERDTQTIVLPEGCDIGFEHESVHHLLFIETGDADEGHQSPLYAACGNS